MGEGDPQPLNSSVQAEAARLRERIRRGELVAASLELAAYCGNRAALSVVHTADPPPDDLLDWVLGLSRWPMAGERAALAASRLAISSQDHPIESELVAATEALDATQQWLDCPCEQHARAARRAALAVPTTWWEHPWPAARTSAHYLGPSRPSDDPMPQFLAAVVFTVRVGVDSVALRRAMEAALLRWIGLEPR